MFVRPRSRATSPIPSIGRLSDGGGMLFPKSPSISNMTEFEIEQVPKAATHRRHMPLAEPGYEDNQTFRDYVTRLLVASSSPFSIAGRIALDASQLTVFFRTANGAAHSLDFPFNVEHSMPPPLQALMTSCRPHHTAEFVEYPDRQSLFYPSNLSFNPTLDLANHPVLDAVRNALFPNLPPGHYITAATDRLEIVDRGSRLAPQPRSLRNDGRVATVIITLPSHFEGGVLVINDLGGNQEKYTGSGRFEEIEWVAFLPGCEYEIGRVMQGCRISITYGVFVRTFGPCGQEPLIRPSDEFLDRLAPVLNLSRGRKVAFYLEQDYHINPAESLADAVVPVLRGGDSLLYHAIKLYKLSPELHWTAGGYIWPIDRTVDFVSDDIAGAQAKNILSGRMPLGVLNGPRSAGPSIHSPFSNASHPGVEDEVNNLRLRVEDTGALLLFEADITILTDWNTPAPLAGKERVYFVSGGQLEKLVVHILLVAYVP